jgi:hypothetical protein
MLMTSLSVTREAWLVELTDALRPRFHPNNLSALVLGQLPSGEYPWRAPEVVTDQEPDDARYWPTESGRDLVARWRAERALFGREVS